MAKTFHLSEKELLALGFSKVSARALRYVFENIGDGETPELTLVELNEVVKDLAYTPSATTIFSALAVKISDILANQTITDSSKLRVLEKRIQSIEMDVSFLVRASRISQLERRIIDLENSLAGR